MREIKLRPARRAASTFVVAAGGFAAGSVVMGATLLVGSPQAFQDHFSLTGRDGEVSLNDSNGSPTTDDGSSPDPSTGAPTSASRSAAAGAALAAPTPKVALKTAPKIAHSYRAVTPQRVVPAAPTHRAVQAPTRKRRSSTPPPVSSSGS